MVKDMYGLLNGYLFYILTFYSDLHFIYLL